MQMNWPSSGNDLPSQERWPPLGASASDDLPVTMEPKRSESNRIEQLEVEKEHLSSCLFSLTTKFAQIQFRLRQISEAAPGDRNDLLTELETFADHGCVDSHSLMTSQKSIDQDGKMSEEIKEQHEVIINELKAQLDDLELFAFKQGGGSVPQSMQLVKQQALLDQLRKKLNLHVNYDDLAHTSVDDLKSKVDNAVAEIVNPTKMKEKLIDHLQTQIQDLERFVEFLQDESEGGGYKSSGSVPNSSAQGEKKSDGKQSLALIRRAVAMLQMFSLTHFSCGSRMSPEKNILDTSSLISDLKKAVHRIRTIVSTQLRVCDGESDSNTQTSCSEEDHNRNGEDDKLTQVVRKDLCCALHKLLGHGLVHNAVGTHGSAIITPISCIIPRSLNPSYSAEEMHPWEVFLEYYELKNGQELAKNPSRMLSRSFNLSDLVSPGQGEKSPSAKSSLLEAIHLIVNDHNPLKRSYDAMFKALVCLGLNSGRLSRWIWLLSRCSTLVSNHYDDSSYCARTGFEGVVTVLSKLDDIIFNLPVDIAVRPFKNITDAF
ncbi:RUN domain-containing protein 1-like isoform X2 [Clavelina lepadiformis]|uniref:RUN domain-containing protein 1-like isoform X2 n=1 Tax=Clavelina lepadiformis TaxID=159417 RepID=UPI004041B3F3